MKIGLLLASGGPRAAGAAAEGMVLAAPAEPAGPRGERFGKRYRGAHGCEPSLAAAYGHDGAAVLAAACRAAGSGGRERLRSAVAATEWRGLTGPIAFDAAGRRAGPAPLSRVEGGRLRPLARAGCSGGP